VDEVDVAAVLVGFTIVVVRLMAIVWLGPDELLDELEEPPAATSTTSWTSRPLAPAHDHDDGGDDERDPTSNRPAAASGLMIVHQCSSSANERGRTTRDSITQIR
jgi:hypothetical protein